jgi:hypothetical protein
MLTLAINIAYCGRKTYGVKVSGFTIINCFAIGLLTSMRVLGIAPTRWLGPTRPRPPAPVSAIVLLAEFFDVLGT